MNQLNIIGNVTNDPQTRSTPNGKQVCNFTVAVNRDKDNADFFRVSAWGNLADTCGRYLAKGRKVCVTGRVSVSTYVTQSGETRANLDVFAQTVEFLSPIEKTAQNAVKQPQNANTAPSGFVQVDPDDEIPF